MEISVRDLVDFGSPRTESGKRFFTHDLDRGDAPLQMRLLQFAVQERIVKSDFGGIRGGIGEIKPGKVSPVDCPETHGTRLAGGIELTVFQVKHAEVGAGLPDRKHLRVGGRIIC